MSTHYRPSPHRPRRTPKHYWGVLSTDFEPPVFADTLNEEETPHYIIQPLRVSHQYGTRLVHRYMPWAAIVLVDGACSHNGNLGAQGGWSVVYGWETALSPGEVFGRLEGQGPFGHPFAPTSNRAELRASIAALRLCDWRGEGFKNLIIATDSSYVVKGATSWSRTWVCNGWRTSGGAPVENKDLWELLLRQVCFWASQGLLVLFWKIPRELNQEADFAAKAASLYGFYEPEFVDWVIRDPDPPRGVPEMAPVKPWERVVVLCPHSTKLVDYRYRPLLSRIRRYAQLFELGQTIEQCHHLLSKGAPSSVILITDNITRCSAPDISSLVQAHLRNGCIVVLTGEFGRYFPESDTNYVFDTLGVAWKVGPTTRARGERSMAFGVQQPRLFHMLPHAYKQCGLSVTGVTPREQVYIQEGSLGRTPTAVAKVDRGYLCFVGDESPQSEDVIMAMCCGLYD